MYKATLILTGMLGVPASPTTVTLTGNRQSAMALAGTRGGALTLGGGKPQGLTLTASLDLTPLQGG